MARTMTVTVSPRDGNGKNENKQGQRVHFINIVEGQNVATTTPKQLLYKEAAAEEAIALFDYVSYPFFEKDPNVVDSWGGTPTISHGDVKQYGYAAIRQSNDMIVSIYRQEIGIDAYGKEVELSNPVPVTTGLTQFHVKDYNVTNNRWYKYMIYPYSKDAVLYSREATVKTKWWGWSITELHPVDGEMKRFTCTSSDVWVFDLNVETGDQTQNIVVSEQQTLGTYPRFAIARQNYISGNVSCLLGQMLPANYVINKQTERLENEGGYREQLPFSASISSNDRVDMLKAWRKVVHSGNPKLLKDRKGQSFLIVINESSNKPQDSIQNQPDVISFTWTEIGSADGIRVIDTSVRGGAITNDTSDANS